MELKKKIPKLIQQQRQGSPILFWIVVGVIAYFTFNFIVFYLNTPSP